MRIKVERSGGYAGISEEVASIDTEQLDPPARDRIEQLIGETRFFDLPNEAAGGVGADFFRYEITVADNGRQHTVAFADDGGPETEPLRKLVETVTAAG